MKLTTHRELVNIRIKETREKLARRFSVSADIVSVLEFEHGCKWLEEKRYADDAEEAKRWQHSQVYWSWWQQQFSVISAAFLREYNSTSLSAKELARILGERVMKFDKYPPDKITDRI